MKFAQISLLKMSITRNSRKFLELKLYGAKVVFAQNDSAKKKFAEISCMEITLLKMLRSNFCESFKIYFKNQFYQCWGLQY